MDKPFGFWHKGAILNLQGCKYVNYYLNHLNNNLPNSISIMPPHTITFFDVI